VISTVPSLEGAKKVVIVGGGFAGLTAAKVFANERGVHVTILDRHNYHLFQPLLYQVAMAGLSPGDIATPIRTELAQFSNIRVLLANALGVDLKAKHVVTDIGAVSYDYLLLACGAQHSYFGKEEWEPFAPGLKSLEQATEIRRRVLTAFEEAEAGDSPENEAQLMTFVIVGGGPTGVELAGALGEITRFTLSKDFRHIDPRKAKIILVEAGPRLLAQFDEKLSARARQDLEKLGVEIRTGVRVTDIKEGQISIGSEVIKAATILWAAGVKPAAINAALGVPLDKQGRVIVGEDLSIASYPEVFVTGDQAGFTENGKSLPGLAPVALQQGRAAAKSILNEIRGHARIKFRYKDKGQMATIGRSRAVAETGSLRLTGFIAWLAWLLVHIYYLVGFKNRVVVMFQWAWSYLTFKRGAQLIVSREWRSFPTSGALSGPASGQSATPVATKPTEI
jgi:NADH dehydrogenase